MTEENKKFTKEEAAKRDALLLKMLKTPPQPRPKRERGAGKKPPSKSGGD